MPKPFSLSASSLAALLGALLWISTFSAQAQTADEFPGLRALMSDAQFRESGLDTLTPEQLDALENWMRVHFLSAPPIAAERVPAADATEGAAVVHSNSAGRADAAADSVPPTPVEAAAASSDDIGLPRRQDRQKQQVTARLSDDFRGWDGKTLFHLDNGQVWQQRLSGRYRYQGPANPEVIIKRNMLGFFQLKLVEDGHGIGVKRLR